MLPLEQESNGSNKAVSEASTTMAAQIKNKELRKARGKEQRRIRPAKTERQQ